MSFSLMKGLVVINHEEPYETINHVELFNQIARELYKEYNNPTFEYNASTFVMGNTVTPQRCSISPVNIAIEFDNTSGFDAFNKLIMNTTKILRDKGVLNKFNRIGYRTFWGKEYKNIQDANNAIVKAFNIDEVIISNFGKADGLRCGFTTHDDDYTVNYNFQTAINREIKINNGMQVSETEKNCIIGDFDIYIDNDCKYSSIFTYLSYFASTTKEKLSVFEGMIKEV